MTQKDKSHAPAQPDGKAQAALSDSLRTAISHHEAGQLQQAANLYQRIINAHPNCTDALHLLGVVALQAGHPHDAAKYIGLAIDKNPRVPDYYYNRGLALVTVGDLAEAIAHFRKAVELRPDYAEAYNNLGNALKEQGQLKEAEHHYRKAIDLHPHYASAHSNLGAVLVDLGMAEEAAMCHRRAIEIEPTDPEAHHNLANALRTSKRYAEAIVAYESALRLDPGFVAASVNLGLTLKEFGQPAAAVDVYRAALKIEPRAADVYNNLGAALYEQGQVRSAEAAFREAFRLRPTYADAYRNLGLLLVDRGRTSEAVSAYRQSLQLDADSAKAFYGLTLCTTYDSLHHDDAIKIVQLLAKSDLHEEDVMLLHFALGKICNDCGVYEEAFDHYERANRNKHRTSHWNVRDFSDSVGRIIRTFEPSIFANGKIHGSTSDTPVFIVGLPRSGKSLVESTIARHPKAHGAGELNNMPRLATSIARHLRGVAAYPEGVKYIDQNIAKLLAEEYLSQSIHDTSSDIVRICDSTPSNLYYLGFIALLFPRARIIHCVRDKMDTCLFMFFKHFAHDEFAYTYDLAELGACYREYERLMAYWREVLPLQMYEIQYEELVSGEELQAKKLIDFLGLPWEQQCLLRPGTFHTNEVEHWRNYEKYLRPLKQSLRVG